MSIDPHLTDKLISLEIMGGNLTGTGNVSVTAEFNFHADPEAAYVVLNRTSCPTQIVPWETCLMTPSLNWKWRLEELGKIDSPQAELMNRVEGAWAKKQTFGDRYISCDMLAMACALNRACVAKSNMYLVRSLGSQLFHELLK